MGLFRYTTGQRGQNLVTIFERRPGGILQLERWDSGKRVQVSTRKYLGVAVTAKTPADRKQARHLADLVALRIDRQRRERAGEQIHGKRSTVADLLEAMHQDREAGWRPRYVESQVYYRRWWTGALGAHTELSKITPALVRKCVADASKDWTANTQRHYLRYIREAAKWAHEVGRMTTEDHLRGLKYPKVQPQRLTYTREELQVLLPTLVEVDLRAGTIAQICYWTGRRFTAVRTLRKDAIKGDATINFPGGTDKMGTEGVALVPEHVFSLIQRCLRTPGPNLFPSRDGTPIDRTIVYQALYEAEGRCGIARVKGRSMHALKRAYATDSKGLRGRDFQSGTTDMTMDRIYVHDDIAAKRELLEGLEARRGE